MAAEIRIQPIDRLEAAREAYEPLARALEEEGYSVRFAETPQTGYGVTWWEVCDLLIDETERHGIDVLLTALTAAFVAWAGKRMKSPEGGRAAAPKSAMIYGPHGKPLRKVEVADSEGKPAITDY